MCQVLKIDAIKTVPASYKENLVAAGRLLLKSVLLMKN